MNKNVEKWLDSVYQNYLKKNDSLKKHEIDHIIDWMESPDGMIYNDRLFRISVPAALKHSEKWTKKLQKQAKKIQSIKTNLDGTKILKEWNDNFKMVELESEDSFGQEGIKMGHCVYSYYRKQNVVIFSLRDPENEPHCTIEYRPQSKEIIQIKGKENKPISTKYNSYVVDFLNNFELLEWEKIQHFDLEDTGISCFGNYLFLENDIKKNINFARDLKVKNSRISHKLKTITIEGNLTLNNVSINKNLAEKIIIKGDLTIIDCPGLLRLADEIEVEGYIEIENCASLKRLGKVEKFQDFIYIEDCPLYNKMPEADRGFELNGVPILEKKL